MKINSTNVLAYSMQNRVTSSNQQPFSDYMQTASQYTKNNLNHPFNGGSSVSEEINLMFQEDKASIMYRTADAEKLQTDFTRLIEKAVNENAYSNPKEFLKSLSVEERQTLKEMHSYGTDILDNEIDQMSEEGAYNLLVPRHLQVDMNNDNFVDIANAKTFKFPAPNSPENVKEAWADFTKDMPESEKMMAQAKMFFSFASINVETGVTTVEMPYQKENFSYVDWAKERIEATEYFKASSSAEQYKRDMEFYNSFLNIAQKYRI